MNLIIKFSLFIFIATNALAKNYSCVVAAKKYEKKYNLPENLLLSIALTESGRKVDKQNFLPWPWTINAKGKGMFFKTKTEVVEYVKNYVKKGKKNIDLGCMQVNYMYHPKAFTNFDNAFNPDTNVEWASKKLIDLYKKFGSWKKAVGYYHSYRNTKRRKYSAKVYNTLLFVKNNKNYDIVSSNNDQTPDNYQDIAFKNNVKIKTQTNKVNRKPVNQFNNEPNINIIAKNSNTIPLTHSEYILARMEKVNFFRNYFYKTKKD